MPCTGCAVVSAPRVVPRAARRCGKNNAAYTIMGGGRGISSRVAENCLPVSQMIYSHFTQHS
jgi:hypothetical protein